MNRGPEPGQPYARDGRRRAGILVKAVAAVAVLALAAVYFSEDGQSIDPGTTFAAVRGDLKISVLQGGTMKALESQKVRSEVKGWPKILTIVEEGYRVTAEDVANNMVLVELDRDELERKQIDELLSYQADSANLTRVQQELEIQILNNDSVIKQAELDRKFAHLEFEKYMGVQASTEILEELNLEEAILSGEATGSYSAVIAPMIEEPAGILDTPINSDSDLGQLLTEKGTPVEAPPEFVRIEVPKEPADFEFEMTMTQIPEVVFQRYAVPEKLGDGAARQKLREFDDRLAVAERKLKLDQTKLDGTRQLYARDFVNRNQLETEEMQVANSILATQSAETARSLFIRYEFPKEAEKLLSDYENALRSLVRRRIETASWLLGKTTELKYARKHFAVRVKQLNEANYQLSRTVLTAEREGLVVYGGEDKNQWGSDQVKEGAAVRQWQTILTIPDMNTMAVLVKIHESDIKSIQKGQRANIVVDAYPDQPLTGTVGKVAVLANSQDRYMNPDLKVYDVSVRIDQTYEWVKPGMSAETEIQVSEFLDVLYIPIQAIHSRGTERFCYIAHGGGTAERRAIETGEFNDKFIIVTSGLEEGERVHLRVPAGESVDTEEPDAEQYEEQSDPVFGEIPRPPTAAKGKAVHYE